MKDMNELSEKWNPEALKKAWKYLIWNADDELKDALEWSTCYLSSVTEWISINNRSSQFSFEEKS